MQPPDIRENSIRGARGPAVNVCIPSCAAGRGRRTAIPLLITQKQKMLVFPRRVRACNGREDRHEACPARPLTYASTITRRATGPPPEPSGGRRRRSGSPSSSRASGNSRFVAVKLGRDHRPDDHDRVWLDSKIAPGPTPARIASAARRFPSPIRRRPASSAPGLRHSRRAADASGR